MIFRSNISAPDLSPHFKLLSVPRHFSFGHDAPSDPDFEPDCTYMTHDEASILYECARRCRGLWADVGSRFGWTTAHIREAGNDVIAIDPIYQERPLAERAEANINACHQGSPFEFHLTGCTSGEYFDYRATGIFDGVCIDGNHDHPEPLNDAKGAMAHLKDTGVIVFHDMYGSPQHAAKFLMENGFQCRIYYTPNGMAVCWRGNFEPPEHIGDPVIRASITPDRFPGFPLERCA